MRYYRRAYKLRLGMGFLADYCEKLSSENREKSRLFAIIAGILFGTGWWVLIGATVDLNYGSQIRGEYYLPTIFQLVSFLLINLISWEAMDANNADQFSSPNVVVINRALFLLGILVQLACLVFSVYIVVSDFAEVENEKNPGTGVMIIVSNLFLFASTWLMRWGNIPIEYEG